MASNSAVLMVMMGPIVEVEDGKREQVGGGDDCRFYGIAI